MDRDDRHVNAILAPTGHAVPSRNRRSIRLKGYDNEKELNRIRDYITQNPVKWEWARKNPKGIGTGKREYRERLVEKHNRDLLKH
jgi:hypothetical protein